MRHKEYKFEFDVLINNKNMKIDGKFNFKTINKLKNMLKNVIIRLPLILIRYM